MGVINLSSGAIRKITRGEMKDTDPAPVLQVTGIKCMVSRSAEERYAVFLSDGEFKLRGLLLEWKNHLVKSHKLQLGSAVELTKYRFRIEDDTMYLIIVDLDVIKDMCDDFYGHPFDYDELQGGEIPFLKVGHERTSKNRRLLLAAATGVRMPYANTSTTDHATSSNNSDQQVQILGVQLHNTLSIKNA